MVGENLRRLREQRRLTQHEAARLLQGYGLRWSRSKIAAIEAGDRPNVSLEDVLLAAFAFDVPVAELFDGEGDVVLSARIPPLSRRSVGYMLRGIVPPLFRHHRSAEEIMDEEDRLAGRRDVDDEPRVKLIGGTEADQALARRIDVPLKLVTMVAISLWGSTLTDERDRRVAELGELDPGERQARRGHITRELSLIIEDELIDYPYGADGDEQGE